MRPQEFASPRLLPRLLPLTLAAIIVSLALLFLQAGSVWTLITAIFACILIAVSIAQEFSRLIDAIEYPNCAACESDSAESLWSKDKLGMVRCSNCGQIRSYPRFKSPRRALVLQLWSWHDSRNPTRLEAACGSSNIEKNIAPKLDLISSFGFSGEGNSLIDIGCSTGVFLNEARDRGFDVTGIEPGWASAAYTRRRLGVKVHTSDIERFETNDKFDVVVCLHVIEHVPDPLAVMKKLGGLCKKDGIVFLATPNLGCERARSAGVDWEAVGPADHLHLFDEPVLRNLAAKAGLEEIGIFDSGESGEELIGIFKKAD